jgi:CRISPR-associated protein Cmr6
MPIAAVPEYLGRDFREASPAMRFSMYLPIWTGREDQEAEIHDRVSRRSYEAQELRQHLDIHGMDATIAVWTRRRPNPMPCLWAKNEHASRKAWRDVARLSDRDRTLMSSLLARQSAAAAAYETLGAIMRLDARTVSPFTTGLGNEHPLENGFSFLSPYGLPYLPGSGVKGVLRQAARELVSGNWGATRGWSEEARYPLIVEGKRVLNSRKEPVMLTLLDVLFGRETPPGESDHVRGALCIWDVIPQIQGDSLLVEIMTPHQSHYYQWKRQAGREIEVSPHDSGSPNPISFLTVPPGSRFVFHVYCDARILARIAPDLATDQRWRTLLRAVFDHAFDWLGFGAKTAVGYGAMVEDQDAEAEREKREADARRAREEEEKKAVREQMDPVERSIHEYLDSRPNKSQSEIAAIIGAMKQGRWHGEEKVAVAQWLKQRMQATKGLWKEHSQARRPEKDREYQNTLLVMRWLEGK